MIKNEKIFVCCIFNFYCNVFSACPGIPTPYFAVIEVLDSEDNVVENCNFSATYNDRNLNDFDVCFETLSERNYEIACEEDGYLEGLKIGKSTYNLYSLDYSDEIKKGKNVKDILKNFKITVAKDGYVSQTVSVSENDIYGVRIIKTVILDSVE